jgi:chromate reductase, NAD(P)H dehydrogenase (quinone)
MRASSIYAQTFGRHSTSPGAIGTAVAQQHLRSVLSFCNSPQMNAPEAYIQFKPG